MQHQFIMLMLWKSEIDRTGIKPRCHQPARILLGVPVENLFLSLVQLVKQDGAHPSTFKASIHAKLLLPL